MSESTPDPVPSTEVAPAAPQDPAALALAEAEAQKLADQELAGELMVTLSRFRRGELMVELAQKLRDLVVAVRKHRKGGQIVLTIKVRPVSKNTISTLELVDNVQVKLPTGERESETLFSSKSGALSFEHPDQLTFASVERQNGDSQ